MISSSSLLLVLLLFLQLLLLVEETMALASPVMKREILICGGTGRTGGATIDALLKLKEENNNNIRICALVRDPTAAAAKALEAKGVVLKQGDYNDPSSLRDAMMESGGVDACFLACSNTIDQVQQEINFIKAAAEAAAAEDRPLYLVKISTCQTQVKQAQAQTDDNDTSISGVPPPYISKDSIIQYGQYHAIIEEKLQEIAEVSNGKLQYTCLRPNYFIQNFMSDVFGSIPNQNAIIYPQQNSDAGANLIDVRDIGTIAAKLLLLPPAKRQESYHGKFLNICGPKSWSLQEIAQEFSKAKFGEKDIQLIRCSPKDYSNTLEKFGIPDWLAKSIANTHSVFWDNGALSYESSPEIFELLLPPQDFRTFQDWIQEMKMANGGGGSTKA